MTADLWASVSDVIHEAGNPNPKNLGFLDAVSCGDAGEVTSDQMDAYIEDLILPGAQGLINQFLGQSYTSADVPDAVMYCAVRVAARGLMNIAINKKGGLITVNQWMQALADPTIFTPELKAEIQDFAASASADRAGSIAVSTYKTRTIARRWDENTDELTD